MGIAVAISLSQPSSAFAEAIEPLASLDQELLVGCSPAALEQAGRARAIAASVAPRARFVTVDHDGLAAIRNAVLAVCEAKVLAFVDADVLVEPGWLDALTAAWDGAGDDVACIGGPLRLRFEGVRPSWLSDRMTWSLPAYDPKGEHRELDLTEHSFYGGNVSFRCEALRGVGGFPAFRGHPRARDRYDAEHHAQRQLGEQGWRGLYEPGLLASRLVVADGLTRTEFLRARHRFGARRALSGDGPPPARAIAATVEASMQVATSLIRTTGERRLMEKADLLAVALGGLTPRLAQADFVLDAPNPFRPHQPPASNARARTGVRRSMGRRRSRSTMILVYHRLGSESDGRRMTVSCEHFEQHLSVLRSRAAPLTLPELVDSLRRGRVPSGGVCITFDDGYPDNLEDALPRAQAAGFSPTLFATTGPIGRGCSFYWDEVDDLLIHNPPPRDQLAVSCGSDTRTWRTVTMAQRYLARHYLHGWMQPQTREVTDDMLAQVRAWARSTPADTMRTSRWRPMTIDELRQFDSAGGEIGGHTRWHTNLGFQDLGCQREEILGCRTDLSAWLGSKPDGFAYPYGTFPNDFTLTTSELVRSAGYDYAVANVPGRIDTTSDPYALPRFAVPDIDGRAFASWLERVEG